MDPADLAKFEQIAEAEFQTAKAIYESRLKTLEWMRGRLNGNVSAAHDAGEAAQQPSAGARVAEQMIRDERGSFDWRTIQHAAAGRRNRVLTRSVIGKVIRKLQSKGVVELVERGEGRNLSTFRVKKEVSDA